MTESVPPPGRVRGRLGRGVGFTTALLLLLTGCANEPVRPDRPEHPGATTTEATSAAPTGTPLPSASETPDEPASIVPSPSFPRSVDPSTQRRQTVDPDLSPPTSKTIEIGRRETVPSEADCGVVDSATGAVRVTAIGTPLDCDRAREVVAAHHDSLPAGAQLGAPGTAGIRIGEWHCAVEVAQEGVCTHADGQRVVTATRIS
ncbi:hypothetical protein [Actinoalloteichus hymeniacidonis]|uniref:Uncharacterized protein n=1 Tax=Actinoalloteichus hymeniacidonis TaxID=340345 RepID=A0AAC9HNB2_9PSEU|nr:hypothetical protein [Actinoalloteichus hymeniacidonis]AOS62517.1 hypothetical protein TL08_08510 [Actinoalloteichus hymeniacidonis]MBB5909452.1 hypothetical protein [Actinoalloteichus hymeniacidonis]